MVLKIIWSREFLCGAFFALLGILACILASRHGMGSASRMGPGYFPRLLGWILIALGAFGIIRCIVRETYEPLGALGLRQLLLVIGPFAAFGLLLERAGLLLAGSVMLIASTVASRDFEIRFSLLVTAMIVLFTYLVFVYGLHMPIPVWPR